MNIPYVSAERYDADGDEQEELIIEYQNASILMLINLLKRLESSLAAFEVSIENLIKSEQITRRIATGDLDDAQAREEAVSRVQDRLESDFGRDINFDELAEAIDAASPERRDEIVQDIDEDLQALETLRNRAREVLSADSSVRTTDAKAARLKRLLTGELSDTKTLLFAQYVPTVKNLFRQLTGEDPDATNVAVVDDLGGTKVGYLTGGDGYDERLVQDFAPDAQGVDVPPEQEVDVLLATDVLGVGQNLQDSRVVVNYDLPWNPMKMEQRIGRIDRITTSYDELLIYNFAPTGELRHQLDLLETIRGKMEAIAETFGRSAPILESADEQVGQSMVMLKKLEDGTMDFGEEGLEGIGSKYDDIRNAVRAFCETAGLSIDELQDVLAADVPEPQYFAKSADESGILTLTRLTYDGGREEWKTTIFNREAMERRQLAGQWVFSQFPRKETDEVAVFEQLVSLETEQTSIPDEHYNELEALATELTNPSTWEQEIISQDSSTTGIVGDIRNVCQQAIDTAGDDVAEMAEEILDLLDEKKITDYARGQMRNIHRKRRRYGLEGTIARLHQKLTADLTLAEPEQVIEADVVLCGLLTEA